MHLVGFILRKGVFFFIRFGVYFLRFCSCGLNLSVLFIFAFSWYIIIFNHLTITSVVLRWCCPCAWQLRAHWLISEQKYSIKWFIFVRNCTTQWFIFWHNYTSQWLPKYKITVPTSFLYLHHTSSPLLFPLTENISVTSSRGITVFYDLGFFQSCVIRVSVFWDETLRRWVRSSQRFERTCRLSIKSPEHRNSPNTNLPDVYCVWNVMAHAQKPDLVFQRNERVHLNRRRSQFSRLVAVEECGSKVVMLVILDRPCSEAECKSTGYPLH